MGRKGLKEDGKNTTHATTMVVYRRKSFGPEPPPTIAGNHLERRCSLKRGGSVYEFLSLNNHDPHLNLHTPLAIKLSPFTSLRCVPGNEPARAYPLVTNISLSYFPKDYGTEPSKWRSKRSLKEGFDNRALCSFLSLILRWKVVRNRFKMSFVIPAGSNACKGGKERLLWSFSWAKQY